MELDGPLGQLGSAGDVLVGGFIVPLDLLGQTARTAASHGRRPLGRSGRCMPVMPLVAAGFAMLMAF